MQSPIHHRKPSAAHELDTFHSNLPLILSFRCAKGTFLGVLGEAVVSEAAKK